MIQDRTKGGFRGYLEPPQISEILENYTSNLLIWVKNGGQNTLKFFKNPLRFTEDPLNSAEPPSNLWAGCSPVLATQKNFYFLNKDYSFDIEGIDMKFLTYTLGVLMEGSVSQNVYLCPSSYFMIKNG